MFWGPSKSWGPESMASMAPIDKKSLSVAFKNINTSLVTEKQKDKKKYWLNIFRCQSFMLKEKF